ncbi:hypothetical protein [Aliikangiella coralliicola]|uniref:Molecular chaperone n=1 Tax=Aliikangiella coralliicola TaxID=2592383 RepID=A0A545UHT8_9GAMM|nr:hypothetical protein [Aliikangiella coralliicola]TQV89032.1 hypothetical protein FLL46_05745 [Aliikangiella coralliicola]
MYPASVTALIRQAINSIKNQSQFVRYLIIIFGILFSQYANAGLSLSQAIIHFEDDGKRSEDVEVFNQGQETLYVRVEPSVIINAGTENEKREVYRDPKAAGLLVTPQRLVVAPGARKRLRFVRLDNPKSASIDKVFRVLVKPEVGEVKANQTAVKVIVAYEVLVLSQPDNAKPQLKSSFDFTKKTLTVSNLGNTNVLLQKGFQCPEGQSTEDADNQCVELVGKRIYSTNTWQVEVPFTTPVTYQISTGLDNSLVTFEPDKNTQIKTNQLDNTNSKNNN